MRDNETVRKSLISAGSMLIHEKRRRVEAKQRVRENGAERRPKLRFK